MSHIGYISNLTTHHNVQAACLADVLVTSRTPVLPLSHLSAWAFFPHLICMVKTSRVWSILLQCKVLLSNWLIYIL